MNNITVADIHDEHTYARTLPLWQYDYGQVLKLEGVELPEYYEVHFSNEEHGESKTVLGDVNGVEIPDEYLQTGKPVYAWVYLHTGDADGETEYMVNIPVNRRAMPSDAEPTPVQQSLIEQALAALSAALEKTETNVEHYPQIIDGMWFVWDANENQFVNTGEHAEGPKGDKGDTGNGIAAISLNDDYTLTFRYMNGTSYTTGSIRGQKGDQGDPGEPGETGHSPVLTSSKTGKVTTIYSDGSQLAQILDGEDGFSPIATVTKAGKTATITITDANGTTSATVADGEDGQDGEDGHSPVLTASKSGRTTILYADGEKLAEILDGEDGTDIIDDTAGAGDTDKTWSADKVVSELGDVRDLVALPYEELTFPVAMNALCVHDGKLFKSTQAIQTEEAWTPSHWYDVTGGESVTALYTGLDTIGAALAQKYSKPAGGIPASDLAAGVIPDVSGKADKSDTVLDTTLSHGRANNNPVGNDSVAYGSYVIASGAQSQAFGSGSTASGAQAHAEGAGTTASGNYSHSEGGGTTASANQAHAEGAGTTASGESAHSENGATTASGENAHAEGTNTIANHKSQHAGGEWNVADPSSAAATERGTYAEIIGNGTANNARSNARTLDWSGNEELAGDLTVKKGTADEVSISSIKSAINAKYTKPVDGIPASDLASGVIPSVPVQDVQVAGTSVLSQGVANFPYASTSEWGLARIQENRGLRATSGNIVVVNASNEVEVKGGEQAYKPIVPAYQHASVFYALAKLAGADMKNLSGETVGVYPEAQKIAIQKMLGIYEAPWELIREDTVTNATEASVWIAVDDNGNPFELTDIRALFWFPTQNNEAKCASGSVRFFSGVTLIGSSAVDTKTLTANSSNCGAYVFVEQKNGMLYQTSTGWHNSSVMGQLRIVMRMEREEKTCPFQLIGETAITSIEVPKITGTLNYYVFGRRKWRT